MPSASATRKRRRSQRYRALVDTAAAQDGDWFHSSFPAFSAFPMRQPSVDVLPLDLRLRYTHVGEMSDDEKQRIFDITKGNMQTLYDACETPGWSWSDKAKRDELTHPHARFLLVTDSATSPPSPSSSLPVAFLHLRFEIDNDLPVLYAYELQLQPSYQRCGLGSFLMQAAQSLCDHTGMRAVVLTVFKYNEGGMKLYRHALGFALDETSPEEEDGTDYLILSRVNPHFTP